LKVKALSIFYPPLSADLRASPLAHISTPAASAFGRVGALAVALQERNSAFVSTKRQNKGFSGTDANKRSLKTLFMCGSAARRQTGARLSA